jgi:hypothetical protein
MAIILAKGENSYPLRNVTNYMGTLRKVKGLRPLMDKGFQLLWYICMGEVQVYQVLLRYDWTPAFQAGVVLSILSFGALMVLRRIYGNSKRSESIT